MGTAERRNEILKLLCRRRHETIENIASEFGVSARTIQRDIEVLSLSVPLYTKTGRYCGGVYLMDGYFMERMYMSDAELCVLKKISLGMEDNNEILTVDEKKLLNAIILLYSKPKTQKGNEQ